ncbi:MAG: NADH-quinone oxidoreductase subunit NuoF [Deltaproteobacteria bacterium]|nr:NADH-quinone oxidoreductase subunit NuoF [Deltaproteobacteria bacterium]
MTEPVKIVTRNFGVDRAWEIDVYESRGGYEGAKKALSMEPAKVVEEMKAANLRGRGGAGFSAGVKWGFLPRDNPKPRYLVVNGDEGEPGTFKDRALMQNDPHLLVEGIISACWATGAHTAYVYIRGELKLAWQRVEGAIAQAKAKGYLGKRPFGVDFPVEIHTHRGGGAYICGEETALLNSLEGKRGEPRLKPPFPAVVGAFGCPTVVNNVETIMNVPWIVLFGGEAFHALGVKGDGGTRMYGLSGRVKRPGLHELPVGTKLSTLVLEIGGGPLGNELKGVIPGGSSTPVLLPHEIDIPFTVDSLKAAGSMMGTGCAIVLDETVCAVRAASNLARFYWHESCGQCTPCREGTGWVHNILANLEAGSGKVEEVAVLLSAAKSIMGNTICPFGDGAAMPIVAFAQKFHDEFLRHATLKKCPYGGRFAA